MTGGDGSAPSGAAPTGAIRVDGALEFDLGIFQNSQAVPSIADVAGERMFHQGVDQLDSTWFGGASAYSLSRGFEAAVSTAALRMTEMTPQEVQARVQRLAGIGADLRTQTQGEITQREALLDRLDRAVGTAATPRYEPSAPQAGPQL